MGYTSPEQDSNSQHYLLIGTDCIGRCKSNYDHDYDCPEMIDFRHYQMMNSLYRSTSIFSKNAELKTWKYLPSQGNTLFNI